MEMAGNPLCCLGDDAGAVFAVHRDSCLSREAPAGFLKTGRAERDLPRHARFRYRLIHAIEGAYKYQKD